MRVEAAAEAERYMWTPSHERRSLASTALVYHLVFEPIMRELDTADVNSILTKFLKFIVHKNPPVVLILRF